MQQIARVSQNGGSHELVKFKKHLISPILQLTGHQNIVSACQFSPDGSKLASASYDQTVLIWNVINGSNDAGIKHIHKNAITDVKWSRSGKQIYTSSADCTVCIFDLEHEDITRRFREHGGVVNALCVSTKGPDHLVSCSDDGYISVYDMRSVEASFNLETSYPVLTVAMDDTFIYSAGIDNTITVWDIRSGQIQYELVGHLDTVTGMSISPDGSQLLSTSMDNTCKIWDIKPFSVAEDRLVLDLHGAPHGHEKLLIRPSWNFDGSLVGAGAGDQTVNIWNIEKKIMQYKLPGHKGAVTQVSFHPHWNVVASSSTDASLFLGDLDHQPSS